MSKLPASLQVIDMAAFQSASKITIAEIPKGVVSIGNSAFSYCSNILISKFGGAEHSLKVIGERAFSNAGANVLTLNVGSSVEVIGNLAFEKFGKITTAVFAKSKAQDYFSDSDRLNRHDTTDSMGLSGISTDWNIDI